MGFLREEYRQELIKNLMMLNCPRDMAERVSTIEDGQHDRHRWAHAKICVENARFQPEEQRSELHLMLSTVALLAIDKEAQARGMTPDDFPRSHGLMMQTVAKHGPNHQSASVH